VQLSDETEWLWADLPDIGECLVHHDLHTGNLLWGHGLTLIDWEYAGRGNPWLDYATLERDIGLSLQQLQQFKRLSGFTAVQLEHELARAIQVVDQLESIWRHFIQPPTEE
jgi:thiamine kinase